MAQACGLTTTGKGQNTLQHLVFVVLNEHLPKPPYTQQSDWKRTHLSAEQGATAGYEGERAGGR